MKLIATKSHLYGTRRLVAGDEFDVADMKGRLLVAARLARHAPEPGPPAAMVPEPAAEPMAAPPPVSHETPEPAEHHSSIDDLREEAEALGIAVDGRWGVVRLQAEIARAKRG